MAIGVARCWERCERECLQRVSRFDLVLNLAEALSMAGFPVVNPPQQGVEEAREDAHKVVIDQKPAAAQDKKKSGSGDSPAVYEAV